MGERHVAAAMLICVAIGSAQTVRAAASCDLPANAVRVEYDVYSELDNYPPDADVMTPADDLITTHMQTTESVFLPNLKLTLTDGTRPDPGKLSRERGDMVRALVAGTGGDDLDALIAQFKTAAESQGFYDPDTLNIYYIDLTPIAGMHFRKRNGFSHNIIVMGLGFLDETLAHEFGHAFSLDHANFWSHDDPNLCEDASKPCGDEHDNDNKKIFPNGVQVEYCAEYAYHDNKCEFKRKNLMWAKSLMRDRVTKSQARRAACNEKSTLISNGDHDPSPETPFDCPDWTKEGDDCEEIY